jgi:hypothetical protein
MSLVGMHQAWEQMRPNLNAFYEHEQTRESLNAGTPLERARFSELNPLLDVMLAASEEVRRQADELFESQPGEQVEQVTELVLATATVDAMLARDLAALDPDLVYDRFEDPLEEGGASAEVDQREREITIARANASFGELLGAEEPRSEPIEVVRRATERLLECAERPTDELLRGLLSAAGGGLLDVFSATQHGDVVEALAQVADALVKHAPRFLREHVAKIVTLRPDGDSVDEAADCVAARIRVRPLLERVAATRGGIERTSAHIIAAPAITPEAEDALRASLGQLEYSYCKQMELIKKSAWWLRRGGKPLAHLVALVLGPAAYTILPGVFFVGIGYVGYALTDSIDARDLGIADRVVGVVRIIEQSL